MGLQLLFPLLIVTFYIIGISTFQTSVIYNSRELTVLIFTAFVFYLAFYFEIFLTYLKNLKFKEFTYLDFTIFFTLYLYILYFNLNPNFFLLGFIFSVFLLIILDYIQVKNKIKNFLIFLFLEKKKHKEKSKNIFILIKEYIFFKKKFSLQLKIKANPTIWKQIIYDFSNNHKKESTNLAKRNKITENFEIIYNNPSIINILDIRYKIKLLNTFKEAIINISIDSKKSYNKKIIFLAQLIFEAQLIHHYMIISLALNKILKIIKYFKYLLLSIIFTTLFFNTINIISTVLINSYNSSFLINLHTIIHLFYFTFGLFILITITPLSYIYFIYLKFVQLKTYKDTKHDDSIVILKNLSYYTHTFFFAFIFIISAISLLAHSGVAYDHFFNFITSLILPNFELQDIPKLLSSLFGEDIIFGIFMIKIIFLIFLFSLIALVIRHIIEIYIENYDDATNSSKYAIPPEFAKFFSYLVLTIFSIILLYGSVFINYPNLSQEYKVCQSYIQKNFKTEKNCKIAIKETHLEEVISYCEKIGNNISLDISDCYIGMSIEKDKNTFISNASITSPTRSLSDYLPLSIFLALFGTVIMLATRNLLENYFTGLSLKINPPYEEGERVKIDNGEMLAVETIGFRATSFYGIASNSRLVIPHHQLTNSVITNYTQPTLDYRRKITIYVPDRSKDSKNIPREVEKVLLLAAFIATGVKRPRLPLLIDNIEKLVIPFKEKIKPYFDENSNNISEYEKDVKNEIEAIWKELNHYGLKVHRFLLD